MKITVPSNKTEECAVLSSPGGWGCTESHSTGFSQAQNDAY